jgi:hypothetical protein
MTLVVWWLLEPRFSRLPGQTVPGPPAPDILVVRDGWEADRDTVRKVLESTAAELWQYFPQRELKPLVVYPKGGPITLFRRGPCGEIVIRLNTGKTFWAQYAFQFAHEFCHVLCGYDVDNHGNDWFEESLCELASIFVLRRMGQTWQTGPPFDHWKSFAPHLTSYAEDLIEPCRLGDGKTLAEWYGQHAEGLRAPAASRDLNRVVAVALLPIFEESPEHWEAVGHLNDASPDKPQPFAQFLADWRRHAPPKHHAFIGRIASQFGVAIDGT